MNKLYIEGVNAPHVIKKELQNLSKHIEFTKEATKAANGHVYFGVNRITDKGVVVKFYYWGGKQEFHAEPKHLAQIEADNVLKIQSAGLLDNAWAYFITPDCAKGDLDGLLQSTVLGNHGALDYTYQVLKGLSHLHEKRFLHRDIKPANIYLDESGSAVIGDFGSVKKIPEGQEIIPASSHSLLYRPPESVKNNCYGISGDTYQAGIVLYQLLGGALPYDGRAWLSPRDLDHYDSLPLESDQEIFVDQCITKKIALGRVLDMSTIPPWVSSQLKRLVKKACHVDPKLRFQSTSAFMAKIHEIRAATLDWQIIDGQPTLRAKTSYRIIEKSGKLRVEKRRGEDWRNDNTFAGATLKDLVEEVSRRA